MTIVRETTTIDVFTRETGYSNKVVLYNNADINDWRNLTDRICKKVHRSLAGTPSMEISSNRIEAKMRGGKTFLFRLIK